MQPYQLIELEIEDIGFEGEGIAHAEEFTVFVPFAAPGERVRVRVESVNRRKNIAFARPEKIISASPDRVRPACPYYGVCGGCDYMHLNYAAELRYKKTALERTLQKAGVTAEIADIVPSDAEFGYRNKAQPVFAEKDGKIVLGFYKERTRTVKPVRSCILHPEWLTDIIALVTAWADEFKLSAYSYDTHKGLLRHLAVRELGGVMQVTVVATSERIPGIKELQDRLLKLYPNLSFGISVNTSTGAKIFGDKYVYLRESGPIEIDGITFPLHPYSFFQINDNVRKKVYSTLVELLKPGKDLIFIDLYAGIGLTGIPFAKAGGDVVNVEIIPEATADSEKLYRENGLSAECVTMDAAKALPELIKRFKDSEKRLTIYLDPPRKGVSHEVVERLNALAAERDFTLAYLSCNPATLARDIAALTAFTAVSPIRPFDMFPKTANLETLVLLKRKKEDGWLEEQLREAVLDPF